MFRKSQKHSERQMLDIVNSRGNANKCGECGAAYPTWASYNLGILLCGRCANCHRKVLSVTGPHGDQISKVKSLALEKWSDEQLEGLRRVGNKKAKQRWNPKSVPFPHDDDDDGPIEEFLREKYILGRFRDDTITADDYDRHSKYDDGAAYGGFSPARSRSSSTPQRSRGSSVNVARLSHRKPTSHETAQFRAKANKISAYGYTNRDAIVESLALSNGDIELALDILDHDAKVNPAQAEVPPSLPKRPSANTQAPTSAVVSAQNTTTDTPATSAGSDWWTGPPQNVGAPQNTASAPQIYQYTDHVTGQVSYVDANGQQYLDPSNPQHQQLLMQQTNPQYIAQQATKQSIMSLYNQPEQYATNVAVPAQQAQQQQQQQQQFIQQQQQQQFVQPQYTQPYGQVYAQPTQPNMTGAQQFGQQQQFWG